MAVPGTGEGLLGAGGGSRRVEAVKFGGGSSGWESLAAGSGSLLVVECRGVGGVIVFHCNPPFDCYVTGNYMYHHLAAVCAASLGDSQAWPDIPRLYLNAILGLV